MAWYYGAFVGRDARPALPTAEPYLCPDVARLDQADLIGNRYNAP